MKALILSLLLLPIAALSAEGLPQVCASGDAKVCFEAAIQFHKEGNRGAAHACALKSCDLNYSEACFYLGFTAQEQEKHVESVRFYEKACRADYAMGCLALGNSYRQGLGVPRSEEKSFAFYRRACDLGDRLGCSHIRTESNGHIRH